ncbi:MAG: hypothetical protein ACT4PZ_09755 [Panacagrimonas sp.]
MKIAPKLSITALLVATLCSACASAPPAYLPDNFDGLSEKAALYALREVEATDDQRKKFLESYDRHNPTLVKLSKERAAIAEQWTRLDRTDEAFLSQAAALADRRAAIAQQQMVEEAAFERDVAALLGPEQWKEWQAFWIGVAIADSQYGPGGGRRGRRVGGP